jgi:hypothetical protein
MVPIFSFYDLLFSLLFIGCFAAFICGMSAVKFYKHGKISSILKSFKDFIKSKLFNCHKI